MSKTDCFILSELNGAQSIFLPTGDTFACAHARACPPPGHTHTHIHLPQMRGYSFRYPSRYTSMLQALEPGILQFTEKGLGEPGSSSSSFAWGGASRKLSSSQVFSSQTPGGSQGKNSSSSTVRSSGGSTKGGSKSTVKPANGW
jgi:hypothetical protein